MRRSSEATRPSSDAHRLGLVRQLSYHLTRIRCNQAKSATRVRNAERCYRGAKQRGLAADGSEGDIREDVVKLWNNRFKFRRSSGETD
jgi:hypothetical protein